MLLPERPARQNQVPVAACPVLDVLLEKSISGRELLGQQLRLIVIAGAAGAERDFLQANQIRMFRFDYLLDAVQIVPAVQSTNTLVDVVTDESHGDWKSAFQSRERSETPTSIAEGND